jgi:hypothetical protein
METADRQTTAASLQDHWPDLDCGDYIESLWLRTNKRGDQMTYSNDPKQPTYQSSMTTPEATKALNGSAI